MPLPMKTIRGMIRDLNKSISTLPKILRCEIGDDVKEINMFSKEDNVKAFLKIDGLFDKFIERNKNDYPFRDIIDVPKRKNRDEINKDEIKRLADLKTDIDKRIK